MSKAGTAIRFAAAAAVVALLGSGCAAAETQVPSALDSTAPSAAQAVPGTTGTPPGPPASLQASSPLAGGGRLVVLGDGVDGGLGLWALDSTFQWTALGPAPDAVALGRTADGIAVATGQQVDLRPRSDVSHPGSLTSLKWPGTGPTSPIAALDGSPTGKLAIVTADAQSLGYAIAATDGSITALAPAPTQSFTPLVAWLDDTRLLVLATDNQQVSRLAVVDSGAHTIKLATALGGIRVFGVSADRQTIAAATEAAIYAGPLVAFTGQTPAQPVATLAAGQVVWALAPDADGSRVFALSGTMAPNGEVGAIHEIGYARAGSGWARVLDTPMPFQRALNQVYLP